jgi:hypothetical protein
VYDIQTCLEDCLRIFYRTDRAKLHLILKIKGRRRKEEDEEEYDDDDDDDGGGDDGDDYTGK